MATQSQILNILRASGGPMSLKDMEEKLGGEPSSKWKIQVNRLQEKNQVAMNEAKQYFITDEGAKYMEEQFGPDGKLRTEGADLQSEENAGTTPMKVFITMGKKVGVTPTSIVELTADHIFEPGGWDNMEWVWKGMGEMNIRDDLKRIWFNRWRGHLNQGIPASLVSQISTVATKDEKAAAEKKDMVGKGKRDYIMGEDDNPTYVGEGLGDMDKEDAMELSRIRAAGRARGSAGAKTQTAGGFSEEFSKIAQAFTDMGLIGGGGPPKSYLVKPGADGKAEVVEIAGNAPVILNNPAGNGNKEVSKTFYVNEKGEVVEVPAGHPIVISRPAPPAPGTPQLTKRYLIDKESGAVTEIDGNQPIIINNTPRRDDTNLLDTMRLETNEKGEIKATTPGMWMKLTEWNDDRRMKQETHEVKMEAFKGAKDLIGKVAKALAHMGEEEE